MYNYFEIDRKSIMKSTKNTYDLVTQLIKNNYVWGHYQAKIFSRDYCCGYNSSYKIDYKRESL